MAQQLPSSWTLRRLRQCATGSAAFSGLFTKSEHADWMDAVIEHRGLFQCSVEAGDDKAAYTVFVTTWATFSTLSPAHPLHLLPLFHDEQRAELLRSAVKLITWLEMLKHGKGPGVAGTGHRILGGVVGVGKTNLLRGLALVTSALCSVATPLTWSYEFDGLADQQLETLNDSEALSRVSLVPISILLDCHEQYETCTTDDECSAALRERSAALRDGDVPVSAEAVAGCEMAAAGLFPLLLLDNIDAWYRTDALRGRGGRMATQLLHFGRRPNALAVAAGSSACLRNQLFGVGRWESERPALNPAVFAFAEVTPLHNTGQLVAYLAATGMKLPDDMSVEGLLSLSGGVASVIAAVAEGERRPRGRVDPLLLFDEDHVFAMLVVFVLLDEVNAARLDAAELRHLPPPCGLPESTVRALLRDVGCGEEASCMLERWRDGGVLFLAKPADPGHGPRIEFLFPYHAHLLRERMGAGCLRDALRLSLQLHGVRGGHKLDVGHLCRPQLSRLFRGCSQRMTSLVTADGIPCAQAADESRTPLSPRAVLGTVLQWDARAGISDFALEADSADPAIIHIDAWQYHCPAVGAVMRRGDEGAVTAAVIATRSLGPAANADTNFSHAAAQARWGFCALVGNLTRAARLSAPAEPPPRFKPQLLHLCTTAVLDADAVGSASKPALLTEELVVAFNGSTRARATAAPCPGDVVDASFSVVVHDGLGWLEDLLPDEYKGALAGPALRSRIDVCRGAHCGEDGDAGAGRCKAELMSV
jgi:hypothetical protein